MNDAITSFILILATIVIGLVIFAFLGSYFATQAAQVNISKEAQVLAASLQVKELLSQEGGYDYAVLYPYLNGYNGHLYIMAFSVSQLNPSSEELITPSSSPNWIEINETSPTINKIVTIYTTSNSILYSGNAELYKTTPNSVQFLNFPNNQYVIVWFIANIGGKMVRIGYEVIG